MAETSSYTTTPKTSMTTELWYSTSSSYTSLTQIFMVQSIPKLQSAKEAITYGCLESSVESQTEGTRKAENIEVPILYVEAQHEALKTLADANTELYFIVKLPTSTATTTNSPLVEKFSGTIDLSLDTIEIDGMLQETMTIYRDSPVTEAKWNSVSA